jgi:hypothetical protein
MRLDGMLMIRNRSELRLDEVRHANRVRSRKPLIVSPGTLADNVATDGGLGWLERRQDAVDR